MKKKLALIIVLTLAINLVSASFVFAGEYNFPWSTPQPMETILAE